MKKLLTTITLLCFSVAANATDTFDLSNGHLLIPAVIVGDQKYTNLVVTIDQLISFGGFSQPVEKSVSTIRPDTFDLKRGQLIIPSVIAGDTEYRNLRITIKDVISYDNSVSTVADSGFNGEWYPEPYTLYNASDSPSSVELAYRQHLDYAIELWGNIGPLEVWIMGSDSNALEAQHQEWCQRRVTWGVDFNDSDCDGQKTNNYWPLGNYSDITNTALMAGSPKQNACRCGMGQYGFHLMLASAPWNFYKEVSYWSKIPGVWIGARGFSITPFHEYWHILHFSHLSNKDEYGARRGGNAELFLKGPGWFTEGSAVYMGNIGLTLMQQSGVESVLGDVSNGRFEDEMKWQLNRGLAARSENPGLDLGDFSHDVGRDAIYGLGAWGIAWLYHYAQNERILLDVFFPNLQSMGWEKAFEYTFNLTSEEFYSKFESFLALPYEEMKKILPLNNDGKYIGI